MAINRLTPPGIENRTNTDLTVVRNFNRDHSLSPEQNKAVASEIVGMVSPDGTGKNKIFEEARAELASRARLDVEKIGSGVGRMYDIVRGIVGESMNVVQNFIKITQGKPTISKSINSAKLSLSRAGEGSSRQLEKALQVVFPGTKLKDIPRLINEYKAMGIEKYKDQIRFLEDIARRNSGSPTPVAA